MRKTANYEQMTVQKIHARYAKRKINQYDELRKLDRKIRRPAKVFAFFVGGIGALILGSGMSLVMTDMAQAIGVSADPMVLGIAVGCVGLLLTLVNYPLYRILSKHQKQKHGEEILQMIDQISDDSENAMLETAECSKGDG